MNIHVKNTNQPPRVGELIDIPETSQGQILLYRLPGRAFIDNDMNEQIGDSLTYTLEGTDDVKVPPEWLRINKVDGTISGKPGNNNVGNHKFRIRATDKNGEYAEQEVQIDVKNVNDSPLPTNSLIQFIDEQITISNGDTLSSQNKIFMDEEKTFDLTEWFADPDKSVDSKEKLDYEIYIEDNDGNQIKVDELYTDTISGWIKHDKTNKTLSLLPKIKILESIILASML